MSSHIDPLPALIEARAALRAGQRTPPVITLSRDPREAVAYALAAIRGDVASISKSEALEHLAGRIDRFLEGDSDEALSELAATMPIMETLFVRYSIEAAQTKDIDRKFRLTKIALQCQASFARTLALLAGLKLQRKGHARVIVDDDAP